MLNNGLGLILASSLIDFGDITVISASVVKDVPFISVSKAKVIYTQ